MTIIVVCLVYMSCHSLCYCIAQVFFTGALRLHKRLCGQQVRVLLLYVWMIPSLITTILLGIFGPVLIVVMTEILTPSRELLLVLFVLGAVGWGAVIFTALKSNTGRVFTGAMREN